MLSKENLFLNIGPTDGGGSSGIGGGGCGGTWVGSGLLLSINWHPILIFTFTQSLDKNRDKSNVYFKNGFYMTFSRYRITTVINIKYWWIRMSLSLNQVADVFFEVFIQPHFRFIRIIHILAPLQPANERF